MVKLLLRLFLRTHKHKWCKQRHTEGYVNVSIPYLKNVQEKEYSLGCHMLQILC